MIIFSSISLTSFLGKMLRGFLNVIPDNMVVRVMQGPLKGKKWIKGSGVNGYWLGSFELDKVTQFVDELHEGQVIYDIGANVGYYTLLSSSVVGGSGKVYAFEPLPTNIEFLRKHLQMNEIQNVDVFDVAVSDSQGVAHFDAGTNRSMGKISSEGTIEVKLISLDQLYFDEVISLPDVLKIDVEGAELAVLKGAEKVINQAKPVIFLATHERNHKGVHQACVDFLVKKRYQLLTTDRSISIDTTDELIAVPMTDVGT